MSLCWIGAPATAHKSKQPADLHRWQHAYSSQAYWITWLLVRAFALGDQFIQTQSSTSEPCCSSNFQYTHHDQASLNRCVAVLLRNVAQPSVRPDIYAAAFLHSPQRPPQPDLPGSRRATVLRVLLVNKRNSVSKVMCDFVLCETKNITRGVLIDFAALLLLLPRLDLRC